MGSQSDDESTSSLKSGPWCRFLAVALVLCLGAFIGFKSFVPSSSSKSPSLRSHQELPRPPQPYDYESFMSWLRNTEFSEVRSWKWKPEVVEFDLDASIATGKFAPYMKGPDTVEALSAAKKVNKFLFMDDIMKTGNLNSVGAPGTHLYILKTLAVATAAKGLSQPTFLDAGCGFGYLLLAWTQVCGPGSKAVGIDVDTNAVTLAKQYLASPEALAADATPSGITDVHVGDALRPDGIALGLDKGSVDAVNLGLAVHSLSDLQPLVALLREGGLLLAPMCLPESEQPKDVPKEKCEGRLRLFEKSREGALVRVPGDPEIPCRFVVSTSESSDR
eukprot:TRINITY_DN107910_c0_g1_i1.p1 TRINITY_DN107910_c0_g1~~TRINITY_DN107910_c0_g1_i1.p1  ORF type:complete len:333 (+),score=71.37 TRINITY_DN107910_c0_g1_i1:34-1032(+)